MILSLIALGFLRRTSGKNNFNCKLQITFTILIIKDNRKKPIIGNFFYMLSFTRLRKVFELINMSVLS